MTPKGNIHLRLSLLDAKFRNDGQLTRALFRISKKTFTADDILVLTAFIRRVYFASSLTGYSIQSGLARKDITRYGAFYSLQLADDKAKVVPDKVIETLTKSPEFRLVVNEMLSGNAVREGFGKGQAASAAENALTKKTWIRTGESVTGENRPHSILEGVTIPASEKFLLPEGYEVDAPHDWSIPNPAKSWINCRHAAVYT